MLDYSSICPAYQTSLMFAVNMVFYTIHFMTFSSLYPWFQIGRGLNFLVKGLKLILGLKEPNRSQGLRRTLDALGLAWTLWLWCKTLPSFRLFCHFIWRSGVLFFLLLFHLHSIFIFFYAFWRTVSTLASTENRGKKRPCVLCPLPAGARPAAEPIDSLKLMLKALEGRGIPR